MDDYLAFFLGVVVISVVLLLIRYGKTAGIVIFWLLLAGGVVIVLSNLSWPAVGAFIAIYRLLDLLAEKNKEARE